MLDKGSFRLRRLGDCLLLKLVAMFLAIRADRLILKIKMSRKKEVVRV
jgi:hypothetical protein